MKDPLRIFQWLMPAATFLLVTVFALPQSAPHPAGWYTAAQAANGAKAYQKTCAGCHGAALQGAMGPALVGRQFWLTYAGKKVSTLWSAVHTTMPMTAPGSVSAKNSINIMAFLMQRNGVPAGTTPLDDTADLSKALPSR
jgi:mono/diheme cytochrome c family protein